MTRRVRVWLPAIVWAGVLFALSSIPGDSIPPVPGWQIDKVVHAALYGVLGLLCGRALTASTTLAGARIVPIAAALATVYGITDELHQLLTPRRSCDWRDVVADALGALLGAGLAARLHRRGNFTPTV